MRNTKYNYVSSIERDDVVKREYIVLLAPNINSSQINSNDQPIIIQSNTFQNITSFYDSELILTVAFHKSSTTQNGILPDIDIADLDNVCPINNFVFSLFDSME